MAYLNFSRADRHKGSYSQDHQEAGHSIALPRRPYNNTWPARQVLRNQAQAD